MPGVHEIRAVRRRSAALALTLIVATGSFATAAPRSAIPAGSPPLGSATHDRFAALALSLDFDLERIFRFVADEIRYEPYEGILRGAGGTLDAGAGNSLDQALLMAALLGKSGVPYRFARGTLDEAQAANLIDSSSMDPTEATEAAEIALSGGPFPPPIEIVDQDPADPRDLAAIESEAHAALEASETRISDSVTLITTALADADIALGAGSLTSPASLLPPGETMEHTWLQAARGSEWLDLDATLGPGAAVGGTLVEASETLDSLPDELRHVVRFDVLLERVSGDSLSTSTVIEYAGYADELRGEPITLSHVPPSAVQRLGVAITGLAGEAQLAYHPILTVPGGTLVSNEGVSFGVSGGHGGVFDVASPSPGAIADGEASAEWLAVTIESPGADPITARRTVFDRVAAGARFEGYASAADVQPIELVPWATNGGSDFAPMLGTDAFAISTGPANPPGMLARAIAPDADMFGILAASYMWLRDVVAVHDTIDDGVVTFVDRPGVVSFFIDVGVNGEEPALIFGLDIWHRSLSAIPSRGSTATHADAMMRAGVVEHIAERIALEAGAPDISTVGRSVGVSSLFEAAAAAGIPTLVLRGGVPDGTSFEPRARALLEEALSAGDVVVVPAEAVHFAGRDRLGWWQVDPVTGATADMMVDGTASEMVEISPILRAVACAAVFAPAYTQILSAIFEGTASRVLGGISGATALYWIWNAKNVPTVVGACMTGGVPA